MTANWTAPRTWTIGELVTKDIMDTHLRDNLEYLYGHRGQFSIEIRSLDNALVTSPLDAANNTWLSNSGTPAIYLNVTRFDNGTLDAISKTINIPDSYSSAGRIVFEYFCGNVAHAGSAYVFGANITKLSSGETWQLNTSGTTTYATVIAGSYITRQFGTLIFTDMNGGSAGDLAVIQFWRNGTASTDTVASPVDMPSIRFEWD